MKQITLPYLTALKDLLNEILQANLQRFRDAIALYKSEV